MANCYKIEILDVPATFPESLKDNGRVFLDVGDNDLVLAKDLGELTNVDTLKIDGVLGFSVDQTKVNKLLLDRYVDPTIVNNNADPIEIRLWKGSRVLRQRWLHVDEKNDRTCKYRIHINYGKDHWVHKLKELTICDVYKGIMVEWTKAAIEDKQLNHWQYVDGADGYTFPFVHYGGLHSNHLTISDLRPFIHQTHLLKTAFSKIGWTLNCPILDTAFFRKIALYLNSKNYGKAGIEDYRVIASTNGWKNMLGASSTNLPRIGIFFDDIVSGGPYITTDLTTFPTTQSITHNTIFDFCLTGRARKTDGDAIFGIQIIKILADGTEQQLSALSYSFEAGQETEIGTYLDNISLLQGEKLKVYYSSNLDTELNLRLETKPKRRIFVEGDIVDLSDLLDCNITAWLALKGFLHTIKGKIITDFNTQTVSISPPYNVEV